MFCLHSPRSYKCYRIHNIVGASYEGRAKNSTVNKHYRSQYLKENTIWPASIVFTYGTICSSAIITRSDYSNDCSGNYNNLIWTQPSTIYIVLYTLRLTYRESSRLNSRIIYLQHSLRVPHLHQFLCVKYKLSYNLMLHFKIYVNAIKQIYIGFAILFKMLCNIVNKNALSAFWYMSLLQKFDWKLHLNITP